MADVDNKIEELQVNGYYYWFDVQHERMYAISRCVTLKRRYLDVVKTSKCRPNVVLMSCVKYKYIYTAEQGNSHRLTLRRLFLNKCLLMWEEKVHITNI